MKKLSGLVLCGVLLFSGRAVLADGVAQGQIVRYTTGAQNGQEYLLVYFSSISGAPDCGGGAGSTRFIMSSTAANYRSTLASVMAAFFSGASVTARGLNTCSYWSNTEDLSFVCPGQGC